MERIPITSSHIKSVGHENDVMEVEYASGKVYRYTNVGDDKFLEIIGSESPGRSLRQAIHSDGVVGIREPEPLPVELY